MSRPTPQIVSGFVDSRNRKYVQLDNGQVRRAVVLPDGKTVGVTAKRFRSKKERVAARRAAKANG